MSRIKLGVCLASMGLPIRRGLQEAAKLAVGGVQIDATGDLSPERLSDTGRREFRNLLRSYNLELTAVNCPLRHGLDVLENLDPRLEHVRRVMSLAADLGPRIAIVEAGEIPDESGTLLSQSLTDLARHGDRCGTILALESGQASGGRTRAFLEPFDTGSLGVNFDPGNLLLHGHDPATTLSELRELAVHAHAHDVRRAGASRTAQDVAVGAGDIEWMELVATMSAIEYTGWLVVERRSGDSRPLDIADGLRFLRRFSG